MKIFKILFTIAFFIFAALWILFTIAYFGWYNKGWEWVTKIPLMNTLSEKITAFIKSVEESDAKMKYIGLQMVMIGGAILLGYTALYYPLKLIPFLGQLIKFLTFIIPSLAGLLVILGVVFMFVDFQSIPLPWKNYENGISYLFNKI